jgi:bifunctional non-homologous end joining protein LigD
MALAWSSYGGERRCLRRLGQLGSLLIGYYEDAALRYRKVGTGFKDRDLDRLAGLLGALSADEPPFHTGPAWPCGKRTGGGVTFGEWTGDRHAG